MGRPVLERTIYTCMGDVDETYTCLGETYTCLDENETYACLDETIADPVQDTFAHGTWAGVFRLTTRQSPSRVAPVPLLPWPLYRIPACMHAHTYFCKAENPWSWDYQAPTVEDGSRAHGFHSCMFVHNVLSSCPEPRYWRPATSRCRSMA